MLRHVAQRFIEAFLNNRFLHLLILKEGMLKLETLDRGYSIILRKGSVTNVKIFRGRVTPIKSCKYDMSWIFLTKNVIWEFNTIILYIDIQNTGKWMQILTNAFSVIYCSAGVSNGILCSWQFPKFFFQGSDSG